MPERQATAEELQKDVVSIADQIYQSWDGEVDVLVVLVPRARPKEAYMGSTATKVETVKGIAHAIKQRAPHLVNLRGRT